MPVHTLLWWVRNMKQIFREHSPYKKRARLLAILWTLLIFILCLLPGKDLPDVEIPFIDKWAHLILFGIFSILWLCTRPGNDIKWLTSILLATIFLGWLVEYIQGHFVPGRTQDNMDILADTAGGITGIVLFAAIYRISNKTNAGTLNDN